MQRVIVSVVAAAANQRVFQCSQRAGSAIAPRSSRTAGSAPAASSVRTTAGSSLRWGPMQRCATLRVPSVHIRARFDQQGDERGLPQAGDKMQRSRPRPASGVDVGTTLQQGGDDTEVDPAPAHRLVQGRAVVIVACVRVRA